MANSSRAEAINLTESESFVRDSTDDMSDTPLLILHSTTASSSKRSIPRFLYHGTGPCPPMICPKAGGFCRRLSTELRSNEVTQVTASSLDRTDGHRSGDKSSRGRWGARLVA